MRPYRLAFFLTLLVLSLGGPSIRPPAAHAAGVWTPAAPPAELGASDRGGVGAIVPLRDGRVLALGARLVRPPEQSRLAAAIYDPAADRWSPQPTTGPLDGGNAAPTLLPDGRVLLTGGYYNPGISPGSGRVSAAAQIYDPATGSWTPVAPMATPRSGHTATLLSDGTVLVAGGNSQTSYHGFSLVGGAERYDPRTNRWSPAGQLVIGREGHTATPLRDGRVLIVGGRADPLTYGAPAELYDPATNRWTTTGAMVALRGGEHRATRLADGSVLVTGGYTSRPDANSAVYPQAVAERYDPTADRWAAVAPMSSPRNAHSATLLPDGTVLVAGGYVSFPSSASTPPPLTSTERYDPIRNTWLPDAPLTAPRTGHGATPLPDGRVLVAGGTDEPSAELYTPDPTTFACFAETGQCIAGRFLDYWQRNGRLARNGYPLTGERRELLEDGAEYTVQYFERVRLEYHPENPPPYDVLLGQFGRRVLRRNYGQGGAGAPVGPAQPLAGAAYFPETGHTLAEPFLSRWQADGGLAQFGFPITEVFETTLEDGQRYRVQYFERARFEAHPENAPPFDVLLGQFGRGILAENALLAGDPGFARLYLADARLRDLLGAPAGPAERVPGAFQTFERGAMIFTRTPDGRGAIFVLCGGAGAGTVLMPVVPGRRGERIPDPFIDTWQPGDDPGGGAGPAPGLYLPRLGFGKLWRENPEVRDCLGYATDPDGTGYTQRVQRFSSTERLISATTPRGRFIYLFYRQYAPSAYIYERYPDPAP